MTTTVPPVGSSSSAGTAKAAFSDPAFAGNKTLPVHRWVPWIAGFASDFVRDALGRYLPEPGKTVLDPFAGVGTTLVESLLAGHHAVGFEINPYAALACRTKTCARTIDISRLTEYIEQFDAFYQMSLRHGYTPKSAPPTGFKGRGEFYSAKVLVKVLILHDFIRQIEDDRMRDLFRLAFAATMVRYSNYSYEPSLGRRVSAGKPDIEDFLVGETIVEKLREMADDIAWLQVRAPDNGVGGHVINDTFFRYADYLPPASADMVITSPPYLNNYHYNRNTRPHLYWLDYAETPKDFHALELANFGKYWQTVREETRIELDNALPETDLAERIAALRSIGTDRGIYGGNGWANYAACYFNDCWKLARGIEHCLVPGGTALVVIGNSILQGIMIPTDVYFGKIAERVGLELVRIDVPRATRVGSSIIQSNVRVAKAEAKHVLYEAIVELRRRR